jgi:hypothetical protein
MGEGLVGVNRFRVLLHNIAGRKTARLCQLKLLKVNQMGQGCQGEAAEVKPARAQVV